MSESTACLIDLSSPSDLTTLLSTLAKSLPASHSSEQLISHVKTLLLPSITINGLPPNAKEYEPVDDGINAQAESTLAHFYSLLAKVADARDRAVGTFGGESEALDVVLKELVETSWVVEEKEEVEELYLNGCEDDGITEYSEWIDDVQTRMEQSVAVVVDLQSISAV
jgi:hypothetical protein